MRGLMITRFHKTSNYLSGNSANRVFEATQLSAIVIFCNVASIANLAKCNIT